MYNNFQNDYLLLEKDKNLFYSKLKKQKVILIIILWLICVFVFLRYKINSGIIVVESWDKSQKMSLLKKNIKYDDRWDICPEWYHIPTVYEWEKVFRIRCENNEICDVNDITSSDNQWKRRFHYAHSWNDEISVVLKDFLKDFNISLDIKFRRDPFIHWIYREKILAVKHTSVFNKTRISNRLKFTPSVFMYDEYAYTWPMYVRCFSNENLTPEYLKDEDIRIWYNFAPTRFEFDWKVYSWWKIVGYNGYSFNKNVTIPDTFEWIPVIEIWEWALERHWYTSVILGNNLIKISDKAFASNQISEIYIPESVIYIWKQAFSSNQLISINIPDGVKFIWTWAFSFNKIAVFKLPDWLKVIPPELFTNNNLEVLEIPDWIETIGYSAFSYSNVKDLIIPSTVSEIWNSAFAGNDLTEVSLAKSVKIIWTWAFCSQKNSKDNSAGHVIVKWYPEDIRACINTNI